VTAVSDASDQLRRLFRKHAAGVGLITAGHDGEPVGLLVTSLVSVSINPPLISFNVSRGSSSWPALAQAEYVGVHVLDAGQEELAVRFAGPAAARFLPPTGWRFGPEQVPVVDGAAAWALARVDQRVPAGDHVIVVAELVSAAAREDATPLLHHDGEYHRPVPTTEWATYVNRSRRAG
jgi:flavin reductase (DIM6/NTAB) family NADH-FMN oxidoreductase RutF